MGAEEVVSIGDSVFLLEISELAHATLPGDNPVHILPWDAARTLPLGQVLLNVSVIGLRVFYDIGHLLLQEIKERPQVPVQGTEAMAVPV